MQDLGVLRWFIVIAWVQLPTVMYGGYALLALMTREQPMTEFQRTNFRAGHAHAGVLTLMAILFSLLLSQTTLADGVKVVLALVVLAGSLLQSGGFFLHMARGAPGQRSIGTSVTTAGAALLAAASLVLAWAMAFAW